MAKPNGKPRTAARAGSFAGDTEISFGSLGDNASVVGGVDGVPEQLLDNVGLAGFSSDEKFQLDNVLQRVNAAQAVDEKRKERLREQLQSAMTQASSVQEKLRSGLLYTMCELCGGKLYPFNRRYICQRCQNLACASCAHLMRGGGAVQCHLCHLEFLTEAQSGEWFLAEVRRRTERAYFGPEILRASLRRERRRLVAEERARRAAAASAASAAAIPDETPQLNGDGSTLNVNDAADGALTAVASPKMPIAASVEPHDKEDGKRSGKKKDRKEREKEKAKQKASKEDKRRDKRQKHSPVPLQPPPPPPPPPPTPPPEPLSRPRLEEEPVNNGHTFDRGSGGSRPQLIGGDVLELEHSVDTDSAQNIEVVESVQVEAPQTVEASDDVMDGPPIEQPKQNEDEPPASSPELELKLEPEPDEAGSTALEAPTITVTQETRDSADADIDEAGASGLSNLPVVDASATAHSDKRLSLTAATNLLRRSSFAAFAAAANFFKPRLSATSKPILSVAPPRPPPPVVKIAKRASSALLDWRMLSVLNRLQQLEKTSYESVVSNISETEESYRHGIRASGEVELSAQFSSGVLTVLVHRCRGLTRVDGRQPNPYVKTYLLPDKTKRAKRRTHARRGTCSPSFGAQPLVYADLTADQLDTRVLQVSVWHSVPLGANIFLGEALVPMDQCQQIFSGGRHWLSLGERHSGPGGISLPTLIYRGEVSLAIQFQCEAASAKDDGARGRLEIWVHSCTKLAATLDVAPYVKCYLLPSRHQASKRKSKVVKGNPNPEFNAMFTYNGVTLRELRERSIELTLWDHVLLGRNDFLGGVRLNAGDTTRQSWMDARGHEQTMWSGMLANPNTWIEGSLILRPNMDPLATHIAQ